MNAQRQPLSRLLDKLAAHPVGLSCAIFVLTALVILPRDAIVF